MSTIREMAERFNQFDLIETGMKILEAESDPLLELNKEQLKQGYDKNGNRLDAYKSDTYANSKNIQNPEAGYGNPDLNRTGEFWKGFKFKVLSKRKFEHTSTDEKTPQLIGKYGQSIMGTSKENTDYYVKKVYWSLLIAETKKQLGVL
jgi:hypothetical protein